MKFKVGDKVIVTTGKDKGLKSEIVELLLKKDAVIVKGANFYTKNVKPYAGKAGEQVRKERPLSFGKIAILNDKGEQDRIGYKVTKDGRKERVFKKTGKVIAYSEKK